MASMMAGIQLQGRADSGYGIALQGFHCPVAEFGARLAELTKGGVSPNCRIAQIEDNGYVTFFLSHREVPTIPLDVEIATLRREPHRLFSDLGPFLKKTRAAYIDQMILTESLGSVSLTLLYRPAPEAGENV